MGLLDAATTRAQGGLPKFLGASYADRVVNGRNAARAALLKYAPNFEFDTTEARAALDQVNAWAMRNSAELENTFKAGTEKVAQTVQLQMGAPVARAFILGVYTEAARGVGAWAGGAVAKTVAGQLPGVSAGRAWADQDAEHRLLVFGSIVQMDNDGTLESIFRPGAGGLGAAPLVVIGWVIFGVAAVIAAAIVIYALLNQVLTRNNDRLDAMCKAAQESGDKATVQSCIQYSAELQKMDLGIGAGIDTLVKGAILLGALYVGVRYGVPAIQKMRADRPAELTA